MPEIKVYIVVNCDESKAYGWNKNGQVMFVPYVPWEIPMMWKTLKEAQVVTALYGGKIKHMISPYLMLNKHQC